MARCTSSSAGGSIRVLNLPALALYRTAPDNPRRHVSTRRRLLPRARPGAGDGGRRRRAARAPVAQARRAARVPRTQPAAAAHPRGPRRIALERPRREAGAPLVERGTARLPARPGRRPGAGGRRPDRPRRGRRDAGLRPLRGVVRARRLARRGRTRRGRLSRRALDSRRQSVRRLARWRAGLGAAWGRAKGGRGHGIIVEGEPGGGKSRLIEELVARARLDDATVAAARAVAVDQRKDWSAVAGLLAAGLADAPGIAGAPPDALAALGSLAPDLAVRCRRVDAGLPAGEPVRVAGVA